MSKNNNRNVGGWKSFSLMHVNIEVREQNDGVSMVGRVSSPLGVVEMRRGEREGEERVGACCTNWMSSFIETFNPSFKRLSLSSP